MNWNMIENGWTGYKASAKQEWSKLSDEQLEGTAGRRDQLALRVQEIYAVGKDEADRQLTAWQSRQVASVIPPVATD